MDKIITKTTKQILKSMGFAKIKCQVEGSDEAGYRVNITAEPDHSGALIGHHGEGIDALQLIINTSVNKTNQTWVRITVNINDYREQREEIVKNMTLSAAENAKSTGKPVVLNYLPSHERRIAHMVLADDPEIETYSEGEGKYRRLVISPSANSLPNT